MNVAHALFDDYSIDEVVDLERSAATERMKERYGEVMDLEKGRVVYTRSGAGVFILNLRPIGSN